MRYDPEHIRKLVMELTEGARREDHMAETVCRVLSSMIDSAPISAGTKVVVLTALMASLIEADPQPDLRMQVVLQMIEAAVIGAQLADGKPVGGRA